MADAVVGAEDGRMRLIAVALLAVPLHAQFLPVPCFTTTGPCAGEITQLLNEAHLALQLAKTVLILENQLHNSINGGAPLSNISGELIALNQAVQYGQGLAYSMGKIDQQWSAAYPGVATLSGYPAGGFAGQYSKWAAAANDSLKGAMIATNAAAAFRSNSAIGVLSGIDQLIMGADGWLLAQKATAHAAAETAANLLALHQMAATQVQVMATSAGYQIQKDADQIQRTTNFFQLATPTSDGLAAPVQMGPVGP